MSIEDNLKRDNVKRALAHLVYQYGDTHLTGFARLPNGQRVCVSSYREFLLGLPATSFDNLESLVLPDHVKA